MLYVLKNEELTVQIQSLGAELHSIKDVRETEYLWQGDSTYWPRRAPLLFPMVGELAQNTAYFNGQAYELFRHGFIRDTEFQVISKSETAITMTSHWSEETLKRYPFRFCFSMTYSLEGRTIKQHFSVKNHSTQEMPFALGGHTGFCCPLYQGEQFEEYSICFEKRATPTQSMLLPREREVVQAEVDFDLRYPLFANDALLYETLETEALQLVHRKTGKGVRVCYGEFPLLGIWTPYTIDSPFLCIEPWLGMSDERAGKPIEFTENIALYTLPPSKELHKSYSITILP